MAERPALSGVFAAALTALRPDLTPDGPATVEHCRRLLAEGCDGINLLGTTGEATSLSVAQRIAVMDAIVSAGIPTATMMVGTGGAALADAVALTRAAIERGFGGMLVIPPFYFKPVDEDGLFAYYAALIERTGTSGLALYLYNFPQLSGVTFTPSLIQRLLDTYPEHVLGLKDSSGAAGYASGLVRAFPQLAIFPSSETVLASARANGFAGCISATVNVTSAIAGRVWHGRAEVGDADALVQIRATIASYPLVPALRALIAQRRDDDAWNRLLPPLSPLTLAQRAELDSRLAAIPAFAASVPERV